jgi:DNA-binding NtrC family response regulator
MDNLTVLLLSSDPALIESCRQLIESIPNLRPVVLSPYGNVDIYLDGEELGLILFHVMDRRDADEAGRLLRKIASSRRGVAVIVLGDRHDPRQALSLLRQGAVDFLRRPIDLGRLAYLIEGLTVRARCAGPQRASSPVSEDGMVKSRLEPVPILARQAISHPLADLCSAALGPLIEQVCRIAPQDTTVLLGGETGTGKTRLAHLIHELSPRREQPFQVIYCGALAANLIESEMFGHVKGAFTGAERDRIGKFAAAGRGTLLLDDIDSLPLSLQAKLLRAIDERIFEPVGANQSVAVEARLIAASNRSLEQEVEAGRFRADLYYRLNVVAFYVPALRERPSAIPQLVDRFLDELAARNGRPLYSIAPDALRALVAYAWPGNIRELRNVLERAVTLYPGPEIRLSHLPEMIASATPARSDFLWVEKRTDSTPPARLNSVRGQVEVTRLIDALRQHRNNRVRAAAELGISRVTLYNKLRKYGLMKRA